MNDRPTPRTDEACNRIYAEGVSHIPLVGFMEQLECELTEAVNRLNDTLVAMEMLGSKHERELAEMDEQCQSWADQARSWKLKADVLARHLDNAESDKKQSDTDTLRALHQRNEAREQRDRLAVALGELIAAVRMNSLRDTFKEATPEQVTTWLEPWVEKLAALKGGQP